MSNELWNVLVSTTILWFRCKVAKKISDNGLNYCEPYNIMLQYYVNFVFHMIIILWFLVHISSLFYINVTKFGVLLKNIIDDSYAVHSRYQCSWGTHYQAPRNCSLLRRITFLLDEIYSKLMGVEVTTLKIGYSSYVAIDKLSAV